MNLLGRRPVRVSAKSVFGSRLFWGYSPWHAASNATAIKANVQPTRGVNNAAIRADRADVGTFICTVLACWYSFAVGRQLR